MKVASAQIRRVAQGYQHSGRKQVFGQGDHRLLHPCPHNILPASARLPVQT